MPIFATGVRSSATMYTLSGSRRVIETERSVGIFSSISLRFSSKSILARLTPGLRPMFSAMTSGLTILPEVISTCSDIFSTTHCSQ